MFKILGADQKEYGPVNSDVLRQWIAEGRANAQTRVQPEGSPDWKPLSEFAEFAEALATGRRPPPPPSPSTPAGTAKTSGMAIASLALGVLGGCTMGLTALIGVVLGIVALLKIDKSGGRLGGKGVAIAGICVSGVVILMLPIMAGLFLPALAKAKSKAQTINCVSNLKQLALGIRMYANDKDGVLPDKTNWCDAILTEYVISPKPFQCHAGPPDQRCSYAFNAKLSGLREDDVNPQTVLLFECAGGWNISGGPGQMVTHHRRIYTVAFADGSVMQLPESQLAQLRWDP